MPTISGSIPGGEFFKKKLSSQIKSRNLRYCLKIFIFWEIGWYGFVTEPQNIFSSSDKLERFLKGVSVLSFYSLRSWVCIFVCHLGSPDDPGQLLEPGPNLLTAFNHQPDGISIARTLTRPNMLPRTHNHIHTLGVTHMHARTRISPCWRAQKNS